MSTTINPHPTRSHVQHSTYPPLPSRSHASAAATRSSSRPTTVYPSTLLPSSFPTLLTFILRNHQPLHVPLHVFIKLPPSLVTFLDSALDKIWHQRQYGYIPHSETTELGTSLFGHTGQENKHVIELDLEFELMKYLVGSVERCVNTKERDEKRKGVSSKRGGKDSADTTKSRMMVLTEDMNFYYIPVENEQDGPLQRRLPKQRRLSVSELKDKWIRKVSKTHEEFVKMAAHISDTVSRSFTKEDHEHDHELLPPLAPGYVPTSVHVDTEEKMESFVRPEDRDPLFLRMLIGYYLLCTMRSVDSTGCHHTSHNPFRHKTHHDYLLSSVLHHTGIAKDTEWGYQQFHWAQSKLFGILMTDLVNFQPSENMDIRKGEKKGGAGDNNGSGSTEVNSKPKISTFLKKRVSKWLLRKDSAIGTNDMEEEESVSVDEGSSDSNEVDTSSSPITSVSDSQAEALLSSTTRAMTPGTVLSNFLTSMIPTPTVTSHLLSTPKSKSIRRSWWEDIGVLSKREMLEVVLNGSSNLREDIPKEIRSIGEELLGSSNSSYSSYSSSRNTELEAWSRETVKVWVRRTWATEVYDA